MKIYFQSFEIQNEQIMITLSTSPSVRERMKASGNLSQIFQQENGMGMEQECSVIKKVFMMEVGFPWNDRTVKVMGSRNEKRVLCSLWQAEGDRYVIWVIYIAYLWIVSIATLMISVSFH